MINNSKSNSAKRVLITGGAGFIGSCFVKRLLKETEFEIFNLDKLSYCSNHDMNFDSMLKERYNLVKYDLSKKDKIFKLIDEIDPDLIFHFAAESHVDRSITNPISFVENNILGTLNLLEASLSHYEKLSSKRKNDFLFYHVSTDEVFGSLSNIGKFNENSKYDPSSPYSASKASCDHLVQTWFKTFGLPIIISNCSNNFGPFQFPEKLIPLSIINAINNKPINLYGDGSNIRDWLYVEDHIDAIFLCFSEGKIGETYCIGGNNEKSNLKVAQKICNLLDNKCPRKSSYSELINFAEDRLGHDFRYAIDTSKIHNELGWVPKHNFEKALEITLDWYLDNISWCKNMMKNSNYYGQRLGFKRN